MQLRPYQSQAIDELWSWFMRHPGKNPIMDCCVGSGKSLMIAATLQRAIQEYPGSRVIVIAHQQELIQQNLAKLKALWPEADVGIYSAALGRKDLGRRITYATIGSIYRDAHLMGSVQLILCDEAHMINSKEVGMWRKFVNDMKAYGNNGLCVIGWTGTPFRNGGIWLTADEDALFSGIATRVTMTNMLAQGYLCPLIPAITTVKIDASGVRTAMGDYVVSDLAKVANVDKLVESTCVETVSLAQDRKRMLIFAVNVEHAENVNTALIRLGVSSAVVTGQTPKSERARLLADFDKNRLRCLVSIGVLTTGFDQPDIDFIALLRATKSPTLAIQMCGRGMRTAPGKVDCLLADFTDTILELGPIDMIKGRNPPPKSKSEAPFKLCPECGSRNAASATKCMDCGFDFPEPVRIKHSARASNAAVLSTQLARAEPAVSIDVTRVEYAIHSKPGKPDSLRVDYYSGLLRAASEWVCFDHSGYARQKAEAWYLQRIPAGYSAMPGGVQQIMDWIETGFELMQPSRIQVRKNGKYTEVVNYEFTRTQSDAIYIKSLAK